MRTIGFLDFPEAWDGPFSIEFRLVSEHARTVRYRADMRRHRFDLYLPRFMLSAAPPQSLVADLDSSRFDRPIGFVGGQPGPDATAERCVYSFREEMGHSIKFIATVDGHPYSLYVPKEVFGARPYPMRIALEVQSGE